MPEFNMNKKQVITMDKIFSKLNRRDFIKTSLIGSSTLFLGEATNSLGASSFDEDVIVIGAGISGIASASYLKSRGYNVSILESRSRIGGRIWTSMPFGVKVDLGAAWLHGIYLNPIKEIVRRNNISIVNTDFSSLQLYDIDSVELDNSQQREIYDIYVQIVSKLNEMKQFANENTSMETAISEIMQEFDLNGTIKRGVDWLIKSAIDIEYASDLSDLSLKYWDEDRRYPGPCAMFPDGYVQVVNELAKELDINLNQTVSKFEYGQQGVTVTTNTGVFNADRVVITLPLGILKQNTVKFSPPLPDNKLSAIERMDMGVMNKIALKFSEPFWPLNNFILGNLEDNTDSLMNYINLVKITRKPILVAIASGNFAISLEEMSKTDIMGLVIEDLRNMFGSSIPEPADLTITRWNSDIHSNGSYSHVPPGASITDYNIIAEPVENVLFFAGEATTSVFPSTVHGAFLSGEREAKRIVELRRFS